MSVSRTLRRVTSRVLAALAALVSLQVVAWALWGQRALSRRIPEMVRRDMLIMRSFHEQMVTENRAQGIVMEEYEKFRPRDLVIPKSYEKLLGSELIDSIRAEMGVYRGAVYVEPDVSAQLGFRWDDEGFWRCGRCYIFEPEIRTNTPLLAEVIIRYSLSPGAASLYDHRFIGCFGFWIPTVARHASDT